MKLISKFYLIYKKESNKSCDKLQNEDDGQSSHELRKKQKQNSILRWLV